MFKNYEIAKLLIQAKADVQHQDLRKHNAIDYALLANDDPMFEILKSQ
jgi:ankyrin repeat protein